MAKKLSTEEILARARAEAGGGGESSSAETPPRAESAPEPEAPAAEESAPAAPADNGDAPAATPKSTQDVLAAARAQVKGGGAEAKPQKPAATPKSTDDILAAARAQAKGGGGSPPAKASGGGAPKSTSDVLAAARAEAGKGGGAGTATAPAKAAPAAKKGGAAAPLPAGERPSVKEMVEAARTGRTVSPEKPAAKPAAPPIPKKPPAPAKKKAEPKESRRNVLLALVATPFAVAWTMFAVATAAATLGVARFMMPNVLVEPPSSFKIGVPEDYPAGTVSTKWKAQFGIWVVNANYQGQQLIYALSTVCTHLGCTPNWLGGEQKFKCPCHGSGFYITGINFEGPAPRPLERYAIRLAPDGMLEVDKSQKFQEELGQWEDPASKYEVV